MTISLSMLGLIIGCMLVTLIPRIVPFLFVRHVRLPKAVIQWLSFIPICILTALIVESILIEGHRSVVLDWQAAAAIVPAILVAAMTKSLSLTVICGVIAMAFIRL